MENASKALIIAGSLLLAIIIIGMSVFVFNLAKDPVSKSVDNMSSEERKFFNSKFQKYEAGRISGLETKALVNIAMQNANHQLSLNEKPRIPEISIQYKGTLVLSLNRSDISSISNAEDFKSVFQNMLNKINNNSFFSIETELNAKDGIVKKITVKELNI